MQLSLSSFYLWVAVFSAFSILAAADGVETNGENPITYPLLGDLVDAGNPVTITWKVCKLILFFKVVKSVN